MYLTPLILFNGTGFSTCSPYCEWYCNLTARYNDMAAVSPNNSGSGTNAVAIPNKKPIANAGTDQTVSSSATVTLSGQSQDADGNPSIIRESDNDQLVDSNWVWTQTDGPTVNLSNSGVGRVVTFTAPTVGSTTELKFNLTVKDGTQSLSPSKFRPTNSESDPDEIIITVNP